MKNTYSVKPMNELIAKFTNRDVNDPPEKAVRLYATHYSGMFHTIGYKKDGVKHFDKIIDFISRFHIATGIELQTDNDELTALYESELRDKKFAMPKGLLLYGSPGTGKTFAAQFISERFGLQFLDAHSLGLDFNPASFFG